MDRPALPGSGAGLGDVVLRYRLRAQLTQDELARRSGVSVRTVRDIEHGRVGGPRPGSLRRLAAALDLSEPETAWLVRGEPDGDGLRLGILGTVQVHRDGRPLPPLPPLPHTVLGLLALQCNQFVSRDEIIDVVWGGAPPRTCLTQVQSAVGRLRALLESGRPARTGGALLRSVRGGYQLQIESGQVDALCFRQLVADGTAAGDEGVAAQLLGRAMDCWRGPVLADAPDRLRGHPAAVALAQQRVAAALAYPTGAAAERERAIGWLRELAAVEPLHEALHARLMLALYRCGDRSAALLVYGEIRQRLDDELGIEPAAGLREAYQEILRGHDAGPPAVPVPAQLPAAPAAFTGRAGYLSRLDGVLPPDGGPVLVTIAGTAGVGKTWLAVHWAHRVAARFPDGQLYVDLRGFDATGLVLSPAEAVRGFLDALGVPASRIPIDLHAQTAMYRSLLAGRRMLVVLDNARDADQVRPLLPGEPGCPVIVTSRDELSGLVAAQGAYPIVVDLMNAAEARHLLANRLGQHRLDAEPDAVNEITGRCERLPLALAIVAARAAARPDFPLTALARQLRDTRDGLEAFATGDASSDVRAVFSWSYHILTPPAAELFRLLGLHPGPDVDVPAAASLAGVPQRHVRAALGELTRAHLLIEQAPGRYGFHDLLRTYAAEQVHACDADAERATALRRMLDYYLHTAHAATVLIRPNREPLDLPPPEAPVTPTVFADRAAATVWYHAEHQVLLAAVQHAANAGFDQHAWQLAWALADFLDRQGRSDQLATVQGVALKAARRQGDRAAEASVLRNIARACAELGEFDDAKTHLQHALQLFSALGDRIGEADVHGNLTSVLTLRARHVTQREGDGAEAQLWYREGLQHADKAIDIFRSANHRAGLALALNNAGWVYACVGDGRRALACCEESLALNREIGFREHEATARDSLGYIHHQMGQHQEAIDCYQRALDLYDEVDAPRATGHTLSRLGDTHLACGNHEAAGRAWQQAIDVLDAIPHPMADHVRAKLHDLNRATSA